MDHETGQVISPSSGAAGRQTPSWQNHVWTADLRRRFAVAYLIYGFMLSLLTLETISAVQGHNPIIAVCAAATTVFLGLYVARMVYRQLWHEWHRWKVMRGER